jgi:hypothetical protein
MAIGGSELVEWFEGGKAKKRKFAKTAQGKVEGEKFAAEKRNEGMRVKETKKERLKRHQDYDQKAIDADKKPEKVHVLKEDEWKFKGKSSIGGHDPGLNVYPVRGD